MNNPDSISLPPELTPFAGAIQNSVRPCLRLSRHGDSEQPWNSRLGGEIPYWPADFEYPRNEEGQLLTFLMQIDFSEIPPLPDFPNRGLLQLFINYNHSFQVAGLYHENVLTDTELLLSVADIQGILQAETYAKTAPEPLHRIDKPGRLAFELVRMPPDVTDYRFEQFFGADSPINTPPPYNQPGRTMRDHQQHGEEVRRSPYALYRKLTETGLCSTLGGYGRFPQHDDPRTERSAVAVPNGDWIVLLKLLPDDDFGMMWGDCQELHVFIRQADLRQRSFSNLWMYLAS